MAQVKVSEEEKGKAAELGKPGHLMRPGYLGRGTPSTRCTFDEGKNGQRLRVTGVQRMEKCTRMSVAPRLWRPRTGEIASGSRAEAATQYQLMKVDASGRSATK